MATGKKTFIFYSDWTHMINEMPNNDAGELLKHILSYVNDENPETENVLVKMAFGHMKPLLKTDLEKWEDIRQKRSEYGKKGGLAKAKQKLPKAKQLEAVNDNDNVNDNKKKTHTIALIEDKHREFTSEFYNQLSSHGKISKKVNITDSIIDHIRKLETVDKIPWENIKAGANYYFTNLDAPFIPEIQGTQSFRDKFDKLRSHNQRSNKE